MAERLQKVLAAAGIASRRTCEEWIKQGRVRVDGQLVTELGTRVDPQTQRVTFDGHHVAIAPKKYYIVLNKPKGYMCSLADPHGARLVTDLVDIQGGPMLRPVGRLDVDSEGLLFMSNDGEFINRMTHPRYHVPKTYRAMVSGVPNEATLRELSRGVMLDDGRTAPADHVRLRRTFNNEGAAAAAEIELTIHEGRNRQIRRMFSTVGHPVTRLVRIAIGKVTIGGLPSGAWRHMDPKEVTALKNDPAINNQTQETEHSWQTAPSHSTRPRGRSSHNSSNQKPRSPRPTSSNSPRRGSTTG